MPDIQSLLLSVPQFAYLANRDIYDALARVNGQIAEIKHPLAQNVANRFVQRQRRESTRRPGRWIQPIGGGAVLSVDLHKAFDLLTREQLLRTLSKLDADEGVKNAAMLLHTRCQYLLVKDGMTTAVDTTRGVRQGCRLAPALWSAVSGDILSQIGQNAFAGPITVFADDHLGAWTFHTMDDIVAMEQQVIQLFKVLSAAGLSVSPSKSQLIVQVQGAAAERYLAKRTVYLHGKPHWCFGEGDAMVSVPIVREFVYLGTIVTLGRPSDRTVTHRLAEARKREGQLRRSIRSRSVLRSGARVAIWRACVVASALYGLLAQELTAANVTTLRQWYHRSLRAVTGMPAHLTHVSNADLRTKFGLTEPLAELLKLTRNKLRRLAALPMGHAATLPATLDHWRRCEQNLTILTHTNNLAITPLLAEMSGVPCPYCGVYFQHTKAMRQHAARKHGINWKEPLQIAYDPSLHSTGGMPECRHCGKRCSSHQGLKHHIMHNACSWFQTPCAEGSAFPIRPVAGQRDTAPASPSALPSQVKQLAAADNSGLSHLSCEEAVQVQGLVPSPQPAADQRDPPSTLPYDTPLPKEGQNEDDPSGLPTWTRAIAATAQDASDSGAHAHEEANQAGTLLEQLPVDNGDHVGRDVNMTVTPEPGSSLTRQTGAELAHSSVWTEFQQLSRQNKMEVEAIVQKWKDRLAQHCCICNNWALDKSSVKCHLIRMHAQEWYRVAEQVAAACKAHKHLFVRDAECSLCLKQVYGVERHALQCPVLFQACFMSCLFNAPALVPNIWHRLKSLTREACIAHLQGLLPVAQEVSEPLNLFCVLCARNDIEAPIMDIQAWRRHLLQVHKVAKEVLNTQFHEHAALIHVSRPCPFCRLPFQKSPKLHRAKCLPLGQLLSVKHGYYRVSGDPNRRSVGAVLTNAGDAHSHTTGSQGQRREGEACQISQTGQGRGQRPAGRAKAPGTSRRRGDGRPSPGLEDRAANHPHSAGEARSGTQPFGGGSHLRALLLDHGDVDPDHATYGDEPLAGAVRTGEMHDHTPGDVAYESVDGTGSQADQIREGCGSHEGDDGPGPLSRRPAPMGLYGMEPTGEKGYGHRPTASDVGRTEGRDQDSASGGDDGGRHPQICAPAEVGREHFRSGCGIHPGVDNEIQSGKDPYGDGQTGELGSAVVDRPSPSTGETPAQPFGPGSGRQEAVSSSGCPHCRVNGVFTKEASITSPNGACVCTSDSCLATPGQSAGKAENPAASRMRSPHGKVAKSRSGDYGGTASFHRANSRNRDAISGDRGKHGSVHTDHRAGQSGEKRTGHRGKSATFASLPRRQGDSPPPAYSLRNRSNFCYLNSVAIALHWSMISSGGNSSDFGSLGPALAVLSRLRTLELFTHATWKELLHGWRRPAQQHDVTELMSFIMDPNSHHAVGEWQARCLEPGRDVICDRGSTSPFISLDIQNMPALGEALASWHAQHYRRALSSPPVLLAIQLGRFRYNGRRTIKIRTPCDIPLMLELPVFRDDQLGCSSRNYRLCGGIVHVGDLANSGHYRPFCVHNDVQSLGSEVASPSDATPMYGPYTLYDDDRPPTTRDPSTDNLLRHNTYVVFYLRTCRAGRSNSEPGL